jgi:hypothetical protein
VKDKDYTIMLDDLYRRAIKVKPHELDAFIAEVKKKLPGYPEKPKDFQRSMTLLDFLTTDAFFGDELREIIEIIHCGEPRLAYMLYTYLTDTPLFAREECMPGMVHILNAFPDWKIAYDMFQTAIAVTYNTFEEIDVPCPHCGGEMYDVTDAIYERDGLMWWNVCPLCGYVEEI